MNQSEKVLLNSRLINQVKEANNFDFIRFFLAYSVMFNHFSTLTETDPFWFVSGGFRVKGFFIISGFLVMFSFLRTPNTRIFFRKRIQRIMPAYSLTILLCALIGLFLTSYIPILSVIYLHLTFYRRIYPAYSIPILYKR